MQSYKKYFKLQNILPYFCHFVICFLLVESFFTRENLKYFLQRDGFIYPLRPLGDTAALRADTAFALRQRESTRHHHTVMSWHPWRARQAKLQN